jgi:cytochrome P450
MQIKTWSINNSVDHPREFDPIRHIGDPSGSQESAVNPDPKKRDHYTFGAGRRICPGIHIADRSLFIAVARLLWGFKIEPIYDQSGKPMPINPDKMGPGFVAEPERYK